MRAPAKDPRTQSTLTDRIKEARRELRVRQEHFPKWVEAGTKSSSAANNQILLLQGIIKDLEFLQTLTTWTMFNQTPADQDGIYGDKS